MEERDALDRYFDEEDPEFVDGPEGVVRSKSRELQGETGVQDF